MKSEPPDPPESAQNALALPWPSTKNGVEEIKNLLEEEKDGPQS